MRVQTFMCCLLLGLVTAAPFAFAEEQASISRLPPCRNRLIQFCRTCLTSVGQWGARSSI